MTEEEKTIKYLNEKTWFRFIKVLCVFSLIIITLIALAISYNVNMPVRKIVDNDKTIIICNYGNKKQFVAGENYYYFSASEFELEGYLTSRHRTELQKLCQISETELDQKIRDIFDKTDNGINLFDVNPVIKKEGGMIPFLSYSILSLLIILVIFEIIKRAFYYIVTGKIVPNP
jgi:hypothetical protein